MVKHFCNIMVQKMLNGYPLSIGTVLFILPSELHMVLDIHYNCVDGHGYN